MEYTASDNRLQVLLNKRDNAIFVTLKDLQCGKIWPRTPLLAIEVLDRMQTRIDRLTAYRIDAIDRISNGFHVTIGDTHRKIDVGLWLRIVDGELSVLLPPAELYDHNPLLYRMFCVDLLPGMLSCEATGKMLLPINTGVLSSPANKPKLEDRFLIYGEQSRWELMPTLPLCAAQTPAGGMVAVAIQGAAETECRVATDGHGNGSVGFAFHIRGRDPDLVEPSNREIRFCPVAPGADLCVAAGKRLRRHVVGDLGKKTLTERAKESPEVAHLLGAYIMKLFFGVQKQGCMLHDAQRPDAPRFQTTMTFDEAGAGLQALHAAGVDRVYTQNVGWNYRGHDGAYPTRFPVEERLGGEGSFRRLIAMGHGLGYQMTVHDNYAEAYGISPDFDLETTAWDVYGQPQIRGFWAGGASYLQWPLAYSHEQLEGEMLRIRDLGIRGPYYLDGMGTPLYTNYHPRHRGSRSDHARGLDRILKAAKGIFGACATETGFLYCSITPDLVANPSNEWHIKLCRPEWPVTQMLDRRVPVWQLAMSGLVAVENQGMDWSETMRAAVQGQHPRYEWSTRPGIMPVLDAPLIRKIKARHDLLIKQLGHLQTMELLSHSVDDQVETSRFDDGTVVVADFAKAELHVNGENIARPDVL